MENSKLKSFASQVQFFLKTSKEFPPKLKQRLVLESSNVKNPFKFIVGLFNEGVLSDGSSDTDEIFGLKGIIVQLVMMIACAKGADAISGLIKALDESGNSQLASDLRTWVKEDFSFETDGNLSDSKDGATAVQSESSEKLSKCTKSKNEMSLNDNTLVDHITSLVQHDLMEQLEACSKRAVGSLVLALQNTSSERFLPETSEWLETLPARKNNYPISVKRLANQSSKEESMTAFKSTFFEQAPPSDDLSKLATFKCQQRSTAEATSLVQFDKERMMACSADGTLNLWNWRGGEEEPIIVAAKVKNVTCFQYDEEILVTGTAEGTVHLFDARRLEEKWSVRLGEPVISLKFVESTLVVITESDDKDKDGVWWIDISRPDMQLLNHRFLYDWEREGLQNLIPGICVYPDTSFVYYNEWVNIHDTKSGTQIKDEDYLNHECYLTAPAGISTLAVGDLITTKRAVVAGCIDGKIVMWTTSEFEEDQIPVKTFQRHTKRVVSLCTFNGHLLSLDATGKLLMWSGYDLENKNISKPIPRVLSAHGFPNVTSLFTYERWFATSSSKEGVINIWTVPDLWLRSG